MHLHLSAVHALMTGLEVLLFLIPFKMVCAWLADRSTMAATALAVI